MIGPGWAISPPAPLPAKEPGDSDKVHALRAVAARAKTLLAAQIASERACDQRGAIDSGASRARITSANAKWARAAEDRDRCERNLRLALEAAGLIPATDKEQA